MMSWSKFIQGMWKTACVFSILFYSGLNFATTQNACSKVPEEMKSNWDAFMLEGRSVYIAPNKTVHPIEYSAFPFPNGRIDSAARGPTAIIASDLHHDKEGGWQLEGGVVATAYVERSLIQLFGRANKRWRHSGLSTGFNNFYERRCSSVDFFLILRNLEGQSRIVRVWTFSKITTDVKNLEISASLSVSPDNRSMLVEFKGGMTKRTFQVPVRVFK